MKVRNGFVSNSSSSSFIITNKSNKDLTIVDFVKENPKLIEEFKSKYDWYKDNADFTQEKLIQSAEQRLKNDTRSNYIIPKKSDKCLIFGDEQGDLIGHVFDYILRDSGESKNFSWYQNESLR